jgi:putative xylitol transport system substrate-binding protein
MRLRIGALATIVAAVCGFTPLVQAANQKPVKIAAAVYGLKAEFMQLWVAALNRHPAVKSGLAKVTVFDGKYDANTQNDQFDTMITQKYDAIIFAPIDIQAGAKAVEKANEAKIPVIGSNTRVNSDLLTAYIGSNDELSGKMEAEAVLNKMGNKGNVVIIEGPIGQSAQIERRKGNLEAIQAQPNVKVLEMKTANWSRAEALTLTEDWLTSHKGQFKGIIGQNDEMALGAIQAIKQAGLNLSDFDIAGIDGVTDALLAVKQGEMTSILQDANAQAQGALDLALHAVLGDSYQPQSAIWQQYAQGMPWNGGKDKVYNVPWTPVTAENVDALLKERQGSQK